ncbi:hypothetical protein ACXX81_21720 [Pseudomonas sp. GNP013]
MKFKDIFVSREHMFSLGIEEATGRNYLSIPVSNGLVDYEEYYEISPSRFEAFLKTPELAQAFATKCRQRRFDKFLIVKPGSNRGTAI